MKEIGLYIHIPFCKQKCAYCDFISFEGREADMDEYVKTLIEELKGWHNPLKEYHIQSIFFGGGTPSLLSRFQLDVIMQEIHRCFHVESSAEITIEANPGTLNKEKLSRYRQSGINRLSIGLQAWQNELLTTLGRIHKREEFLENYFAARNAGFENISVDLMFGLPKQSFQDWEETLQQILLLRPEHISTYSLKIEEGTPFDRLYGQGQLLLPDEELERSMYHYAMTLLGQHGYRHYEISNFAQDGKESLHNKIYWKNEEYIGVGVGAHSFFNKVRFSNTKDMNTYRDLIKNHKNPMVEQTRISLEEEMAETMFLGLRMMEGIDLKDFQRRYQVNIMEKYENQISEFVRQDLLVIVGDKLRLTQRGIDVSNRVFASFLPE